MMSEALDFCGLVCPMPVLKTKKALARLAPGEILEVLTDDPHAVGDIELFARQSGHTLICQRKEGDITRHSLRKKGA